MIAAWVANRGLPVSALSRRRRYPFSKTSAAGSVDPEFTSLNCCLLMNSGMPAQTGISAIA